jgi:hypothetical protein
MDQYRPSYEYSGLGSNMPAWGNYNPAQPAVYLFFNIPAHTK